MTGRRARAAGLCLTAAAAATALAAPPAAAFSDSPRSAACETDDHGHDVTARGLGGQREPGSGETAIEVPTSATRGPGFRATVPVYFHVLHDGAEGNLTDRQIDAQIAVLNKTFRGREGGYDTGFSFQLAGVTRTDNAEWFNAGYGSKAERDLKSALHRGGRNALNFYSVVAAGYLGWAFFPNLSDSRLYLDGVMVNWKSIPGASTAYAGRYDLGETGTHEVGHWLNLYHVFQGGCSNYGDHVEDTPRQLIATNGCPKGQDSCSAPGIDSIHNYMDYSYDSCYTQFTRGQALRMQDAWSALRAAG